MKILAEDGVGTAGWNRRGGIAPLTPEGQAWAPQFPRDLREWTDACTLMVWVDEAIQALSWEADPVAAMAGSRPGTFLRLLSFAYACGVYDADDIRRKCGSDTVFRMVSEDQAPFAEELATYRRRHRGFIAATLAHVLAQAIRDRLGIAGSLTSDCNHSISDNAKERVNTARHLERCG
jgi:hypothetical protein